jgi:hypothetical protein
MRLEEIHDPRFKGNLWPNNREVDLFLLNNVEELFNCCGSNRNKLSTASDPRITRSAGDVRHVLRNGQTPTDCMFTSTTTYNKNSHIASKV